MIRLITSIVIFTAILLSLITADNPCRFESKEKGVIDISSLGRKDGKAAFPDEAPTIGTNYLYSYNPCKPFSEGDVCNNVAVCQVSRDKKLTFILAKHDSAKWDAGAGPGTNPTIRYKFDVKQVSVELACSESMTAQLEALGEAPENFYKFRLTHKCACWNGCKSSGGSGLPGGAIFIIILLVLFVVYFVAFAIYNVVHHHRKGAEIIPHRTFWVSLPGYARYGVTYIVHRATGKGNVGYENIEK